MLTVDAPASAADAMATSCSAHFAEVRRLQHYDQSFGHNMQQQHGYDDYCYDYGVHQHDVRAGAAADTVTSPTSTVNWLAFAAVDADAVFQSACGQPPQLAHEMFARLLAIAAAAAARWQQQHVAFAPVTMMTAASDIRLAAFTGCSLAYAGASMATPAATSLDDDYEIFMGDDEGVGVMFGRPANAA